MCNCKHNFIQKTTIKVSDDGFSSSIRFEFKKKSASDKYVRDNIYVVVICTECGLEKDQYLGMISQGTS